MFANLCYHVDYGMIYTLIPFAKSLQQVKKIQMGR